MLFLSFNLKNIILDKSKIEQFFSKVESSSNLVIVMHKNPDGDCMGAALTLKVLFQKLGVNPIVISPNNFPSFLSWMPLSDEILIASKEKEKAKLAIAEADTIISVDFNAFHRAGSDLENPLLESEAYKIIIDHHIEPEKYFDLYFSTTQTSSTSELIFDIIENSQYFSHFNKEMAECIYVGIMTDTGSFSYACNNSSTYKSVAKLMEFGVDGEAIHRLVYDNYSFDRMRLLGHSLYNKLVVMPEYHASYIWLSKEDLKNHKFQTGDAEGIVNYGLSIQGINFTALFTEREDVIRISLRSKGDFDVNKFARKHFSGGGHRNASGADSHLTLEETLQKFENALKEYENELNF